MEHAYRRDNTIPYMVTTDYVTYWDTSKQKNDKRYKTVRSYQKNNFFWNEDLEKTDKILRTSIFHVHYHVHIS